MINENSKRHKFAVAIRQKKIAYPMMITLTTANLILVIFAAIQYLR